MSPNHDNRQQSWPALSHQDREVLGRVSHHLQSLINNFGIMNNQMECSGLHLTADLRSLGITNSALTRDINALSQYLAEMRSGVLESLREDLDAINYLIHYEIEDAIIHRCSEAVLTDEASNSDTVVATYTINDFNALRLKENIITARIDKWLLCCQNPADAIGKLPGETSQHEESLQGAQAAEESPRGECTNA